MKAETVLSNLKRQWLGGYRRQAAASRSALTQLFLL
jgi:hypothetical protein